MQFYKINAVYKIRSLKIISSLNINFIKVQKIFNTNSSICFKVLLFIEKSYTKWKTIISYKTNPDLWSLKYVNLL